MKIIISAVPFDKFNEYSLGQSVRKITVSSLYLIQNFLTFVYDLINLRHNKNNARTFTSLAAKQHDQCKKKVAQDLINWPKIMFFAIFVSVFHGLKNTSNQNGIQNSTDLK